MLGLLSSGEERSGYDPTGSGMAAARRWARERYLAAPENGPGTERG
ncbi:hypothetical protein [Streptomyces goshikiensis]